MTIKGNVSWGFSSVPLFSHFRTPSSSFGLPIQPSEFTYSRFLKVTYLAVFFPFSSTDDDDSGIKNSVFLSNCECGIRCPGLQPGCSV